MSNFALFYNVYNENKNCDFHFQSFRKCVWCGELVYYYDQYSDCRCVKCDCEFNYWEYDLTCERHILTEYFDKNS